MKRRRNKTKLRQDQVYGTVNVGEDRTLTLNYYPQTDELEIVDAEKGSTRIERNYERNSGKPKVVSSIWAGKKFETGIHPQTHPLLFVSTFRVHFT